jgi:plastocyanin
MSHRFWRRAAVSVLVLSLAVVGGTAVAAPKKAKKNATLQMKGKLIVKRNKFIKDEARFSPGNVQIRSGGTLTLRNRQEQPHTFSIIKGSDVPRSTNKILNCGAPGTPCDTIFTAHAPDPEGNPTVPVVDVGSPGIDQPGDSVILNPKQTVKVNVSAPKGTTLNFFCAIHAWMQGRLRSR